MAFGLKDCAWLLALLWAITFAQASPLNNPWKRQNGTHWVISWTSMPQEVEPGNLPPAPFNDGSSQFLNSTLRQTFHLSLGADELRIQFSNTFGGSTLDITSAAIALPAGGAAGVGEVEDGTSQQLSFNGESSVSIPPGEVAYSDPFPFEVQPETNVAVTVYLAQGQSGTIITGHPGSRTSSWMQKGDALEAASISEASTAHWYFASAVEAQVPQDTSALVILGDSITDGRESDDNQNNRWPDLLLSRMLDTGITNIGVNNQAAGGNAILSGGLGPPLLQRYQRDAIEQAGVRYVMIFEGVNDIGPSSTDSGTQETLYQDLTAAYTQIVADCDAAGLVTIGATITPFGGDGSSYYAPERDETRKRVNEWILTSGTFDYVVDFDAAIGDGFALLPEFDGGDHLHPNVAGFERMAEEVPLDIFQ